MLKLFYSGIRVDEQQTSVFEQIEEDAIIIFTNKLETKFDLLFAYNRYQQMELPYPEIGFDYRILLWQPIGRLVRMMLARFDRVTQGKGLPNPYRSGYIAEQLLNGKAAFLSLVSKKAFYRRFVRALTDPVRYLIDLQKSADRPIYFIPQLILFGKSPHRSRPRKIDILFGPQDQPGVLRRLHTLFRKPGKVFVELSEPLSLKDFLETSLMKDRSTDHQAVALRRLLLQQINRHRQSITGPALKTRQELKESILTNERFQNFMVNYAENRDQPIAEVRHKADSYIEEIAASYNPAVINIFSGIVGWIIRTIFDGVTVNIDLLSKIKHMSLRGPLIFIPCHKSHIDYLILSYLLYHNDLPCPLIAAGKNLSFWPMGPLFRAGGAFFLRRRFRGAVLYSKVFAEYIHKLLEEGHNIEQFIEGGRSRTGKLLMPKLGLLSILLNALQEGASHDMIIVPIYIGYDQVLEEKAYLHEIEGGKKEDENLSQVMKASRFLKKRYGKIYIQFSDPISVRSLAARQQIELAEIGSKRRNAFCRDIGTRVISAINQVTVVTPYAIVAATILNHGTSRLTRSELLGLADNYLNHLNSVGATLADTLIMDRERVFDQVIESYVQRKFIERIGNADAGGVEDDAYLVIEARRPFLEYYKNNCIAFFIPAAYTALTILMQDAFQFCSADLHADYGNLMDFFRNEFVHEPDTAPDYKVRKTLKLFIEDAIVIPHPTLPDTYQVTAAGFRKLKRYAIFLKTYFESYWIVLNDFKRNSHLSMPAKDRLKRITSRGTRMYRRKEIDHPEALSKINYQNGVDLFIGKGIKNADDTDAIDEMAAYIQRALASIQ
jgi:glycerol-3-phosphate O-acyltransferase